MTSLNVMKLSQAGMNPAKAGMAEAPDSGAPPNPNPNLNRNLCLRAIPRGRLKLRLRGSRGLPNLHGSLSETTPSPTAHGSFALAAGFRRRSPASTASRCAGSLCFFSRSAASLELRPCLLCFQRPLPALDQPPWPEPFRSWASVWATVQSAAPAGRTAARE